MATRYFNEDFYDRAEATGAVSASPEDVLIAAEEWQQECETLAEASTNDVQSYLRSRGYAV